MTTADKTPCTCPTGTRPRANDDGKCPKCSLLRAPKSPKPTKRRRNQYEKIARYVYDHDRDVDLPGDDIPDTYND